MPGFGGNTVRARHNNTWKDWNNVQGRVGGVWKQSTDVFIKRNGVWQKVWIRLTAPSNVSTSAPGTGNSVTVTWTNGEGAEGHRIYRNDPINGDVLVTTVLAPTNSLATTLPLRYTNYTFKVESYYSTTTSTRVSGNTVSASVATPTTTGVGITQWGYTGTNEWDGGQTVATLYWGAVAGANTYYVYVNDGYVGQTTNLFFQYGTTSQNFSFTMKVQAVNTDNGVNGSALSGARTYTVGRPQLRGDASGDVSAEAQADHTGTQNGRWVYTFNGSAFNTWVTAMRWTMSVDWSGGLYITNYPNRKIELLYPGGAFEVPDDRPNGYDKTISMSGQNVTVTTRPYGSGWTSSGSGTIGTFHVNVTLRVYYRVITQTAIGNSAS